MLNKISHALTRRPKLVVLVAVLLLIPCLLGMIATRINYDILSYIPQDYDSAKGEKLLENPFNSAATTMLIVEDMPARYTDLLKQSIEEVPGVSSATWISSLVGIQIPESMIPESFREIFFSGNSTMMIVQYDAAGASDTTMKAIEEVRGLCNKNCFLAGFSVLIKDTRDLVDREMPIYVILAVILSLAVMFLLIDSWWLPVSFMMSIGLAIAYNFGSNIIFGEISYITKAIAAVLQLGVTMDYSIFLYHRYCEERPNYDDPRDAMASAITQAFLSLSGSSLTTIFGFLALCFMQLTLGRDIGLVMAKGVILGVLTAILVLPAILLVMDKAIEKRRHKILMPKFDRLTNFMVKHRKGFVVLFLFLFLPVVYAQNNAPVYYNLDRSLPQDMPSIVATNKLKNDYNMASSHFIVFDDNLSHAQKSDMISEIENVKGIETVVAYDKFLSNTIPDFFIPDTVKDICKKDGLQVMMVNSRYLTASDEVSAQLAELTEITKRYDPNSCITGEAALTKDLIETAATDFKVTNIISVAAIFLIVAIVFRSISIPILLVSVIELAIFINQGIPYFTNTEIPFIAPTVIGCIQLGATVDYAILMTTRFREELQKGADRMSAIKIAASTSYPSIITSALVLFFATLGVGMISEIGIISSICMMLARGAIISAIICIFILPAVLVVFEPIINKTSIYWKTPKPPKKGSVQKSN